MQLKWLEDFITLAQERSFTRAAELRHVTHPAFGRRIRALENWAGTALVQRGSGPFALTSAGQSFLQTAEQMTRGLSQSHAELQSLAGRKARTVRLATGRTLARTLVADWLVRLRPLLQDAELCVLTGAMADSVSLLENNQADFSLVYHHTVLALGLDARQFSYITMASDRLVPVSRADAKGQPLFHLQSTTPVPYLSYASNLAMGRLVEDHLSNHPSAPRLLRLVECDSADAHHEYVLKGIGVAWLPWSIVHADCKAGRLALAGDRRMEVRFDVRLYRPKRRLGPLAEAMWKALSQR